jgi:hypothetical protein
MHSVDLVEAAAAVCTAPPADFVTARADAVKAARAAGDDELANAVGALRKPTAAAWALNLLAVDASEEFAELLDIGQELRSAQADLDTARLQTWASTRRRLLPRLLGRARELAGEHGARLSQPVLDDVSATLEAAVTDAGAAAAVASGRLVRPLRASGFDAVDLDGALAGPAPSDTPPRRPVLHSVAGGRSGRTEPTPRITPAQQRARDAARETAALAERAVLKAENTRTRRATELERLAGERADAEAALAEVTEQHGRAATALERAERELADAQHKRSAARATLAELSDD